MNPMKKYLLNIESYVSILKIFAFIFLSPMNFLISFEMFETKTIKIGYIITSNVTM